MALSFNGVSIPQTGNIRFNGQALKRYIHNGTVVWQQITDVNVMNPAIYTVVGSSDGATAGTGGLSCPGADKYNRAICIRFNTGDHTKLYLYGQLGKGNFSFSRVRCGAVDPKLYQSLQQGPDEGVGKEYLNYHTGWLPTESYGPWTIITETFNRTITVPKNSFVYLTLQGANTSEYGGATPYLSSIVLKA